MLGGSQEMGENHLDFQAESHFKSLPIIIFSHTRAKNQVFQFALS
jgi:hypothetical protein